MHDIYKCTPARACRWVPYAWACLRRCTYIYIYIHTHIYRWTSIIYIYICIYMYTYNIYLLERVGESFALKQIFADGRPQFMRAIYIAIAIYLYLSISIQIIICIYIYIYIQIPARCPLFSSLDRANDYAHSPIVAPLSPPRLSCALRPTQMHKVPSLTPCGT